VRSYACTPKCGWAGLLPSLSGRQRRKRHVRLVFVTVALVVGAGLFLWRYGAELTWTPSRPPAGDGMEESGAQ
jgi:hypothetical protein